METRGVVNRMSALDILKGLMIVMMVFGHVEYIGTARHTLDAVTEVMHTFRMPLFLILCGYLFSPHRPAAEQFRKTIRRIFVPYALFMSVWIILLLLANSKGITTQDKIEPGLIPYLNAIFFRPIATSWFLHTLVWFQLAVIFSVLCAQKLKTNGWIAILIVVMLVLHEFRQVSLISLQFLMIGVLLKHFKAQMPASMLLGAACIAAVVLTAGIPLYVNERQPQQLMHAVWVIGILSVINGFFSAYPRAYTASLWRYLGQNTLIILLTHMYFISIMKRLSHNFMAIDPTGLLYVTAATAVCVAGPLVIAHVMDRIGVSPLIFDRKRLYVGWSESQEKVTGPESKAARDVQPAVEPTASSTVAGSISPSRQAS